MLFVFFHAADVCMNGATCQLSASSSLGYECECVLGFTGPDCSVNMDDCLPTSCDNGGTCIDQVTILIIIWTNLTHIRPKDQWGILCTSHTDDERSSALERNTKVPDSSIFMK